MVWEKFCLLTSKGCADRWVFEVILRSFGANPCQTKRCVITQKTKATQTLKPLVEKDLRVFRLWRLMMGRFSFSRLEIRA